MRSFYFMYLSYQLMGGYSMNIFRVFENIEETGFFCYNEFPITDEDPERMCGLKKEERPGEKGREKRDVYSRKLERL